MNYTIVDKIKFTNLVGGELLGLVKFLYKGELMGQYVPSCLLDDDKALNAFMTKRYKT